MGAWSGAVAAGLSAGGEMFSGGQANKQGKKIAREQMRFQERMSNTAYQRAADDLQKAGLNRVLALGSGASTPSGASYSPERVNALGAAVEGAQRGISSAREAKRIKPEVAAIEAATDASKAGAEKTRVDTAAAEQNMNVVVPKMIEEIDSRINQNNMNSSRSEVEKQERERTMPGKVAVSEKTAAIEGAKARIAEETIPKIEKAGHKVWNSAKQIWQDFSDYRSKNVKNRERRSKAISDFWKPATRYRGH